VIRAFFYYGNPTFTRWYCINVGVSKSFKVDYYIILANDRIFKIRFRICFRPPPPVYGYWTALIVLVINWKIRRFSKEPFDNYVGQFMLVTRVNRDYVNYVLTKTKNRGNSSFKTFFDLRYPTLNRIDLFIGRIARNDFPKLTRVRVK